MIFFPFSMLQAQLLIHMCLRVFWLEVLAGNATGYSVQLIDLKLFSFMVLEYSFL